jgi:hypothetical protein
MLVLPSWKDTWSRTKTSCTASLRTISWQIALAMARSVWGLKRMDRSAAMLVRVQRVARSMIFTSGFFNRRSSRREKSTGCISAMLLPHSTNTSAWSMSS